MRTERETRPGEGLGPGEGWFLRAMVQGMGVWEDMICFNAMWRVDFNGTRVEAGIPVRRVHNSSLQRGNARTGRTTRRS